MRRDGLILALDQSTAGTKAIVFDSRAAIISSVLIPHKQIYPKPGWVEHDPEEIAKNVEKAAREAVKDIGFAKIAAIAVTNQRETVAVWDKATGKPVYNALVWQDGRAELTPEQRAARDYLFATTGLEPSPFFSAPKIAWILDNVPGARARAERGELAFGTMESFVLNRLTGGRAHKCDMTNASRTLLMDLRNLRWDERAFGLFNIPLSMAPEITPCDGAGEATHGCGLPDGIPIAALCGDSHAALFGQCCFEPGEAKATYGTGSSVMLNTGATPTVSRHGLVSSVAYAAGGEVRYCVEGNINTTGGIIKWLHEGLGLLSDPSESGKIAASLPDSGGVFLIPALAGLAAPYWRPSLRASFVGLSSATTSAQLIRAGEEAIAYQVAEVARAMEADCGAPLSRLRADGGPVRDRFLMSFQADIMGCELATSDIRELSALGAAYIAGLSLGLWSRDELATLHPAGAVYRPSEGAERARELYARWRGAMAAALR